MKKITSFFFLLLISSKLFSQSDTISYDVSSLGVVSSGQKSPFWFQNNKFDKISNEPFNGAFELNVFKTWQHPEHFFDYSFKFSSQLKLDKNKIETELHEYYLNTRLWILNFSAGARVQSFGNQDKTLSSGGLLFSDNSRPMPAIFAGIEEFTPVLFKNGIFEIKGEVSHGWFTDNVYVSNLLMHHKYAYFRLGGKISPVNFQYGMHHAAQWGGNIPGYGKQPTKIADFVNVFFARSGSTSTVRSEQLNVGGNHIISQNMRLDYRINNFEFGVYWQNIYEDKPILLMWDAVNIQDGLWGFSIKNKQFPIIKGFLYEYLNTTDQNGPYHDKDGIVYGGMDNYFDNYLYRSGWTYYGRTIGTPFITSPIYNNDGAVYVQNNRVQVHHVGIEGEIYKYKYRVLNSFSKNYGTYPTPYLNSKDAVNLMVEVNKHFEKYWGIDAGFSIGIDWGQMYGRNFGIMFKLSKSGNIFFKH